MATLVVDALKASKDQIEACRALKKDKLTIVNGFHITDTILESLLHPALKELKLHFCSQITNAGLGAALSTCALTHLEIHNCYYINADVLRFIKKLPLEVLIMPGVQLVDKHLQHLVNVPLKTVEICCTSVITEQGMMQLAKLPLKSFRFRGVHQISEVNLTSLFKRRKNPSCHLSFSLKN